MKKTVGQLLKEWNLSEEAPKFKPGDKARTSSGSAVVVTQVYPYREHAKRQTYKVRLLNGDTVGYDERELVKISDKEYDRAYAEWEKEMGEDL